MANPLALFWRRIFGANDDRAGRGGSIRVTAAIYLAVIGGAYALGTLFAMLQDRAFRDAIALQRSTRKVARLREPFLLIAGYVKTGELLGRFVRHTRAALRRH